MALSVSGEPVCQFNLCLATWKGNSSLEEFLKDFPTISREAAVAVLEVAKKRLFAHAPAA